MAPRAADDEHDRHIAFIKRDEPDGVALNESNRIRERLTAQSGRGRKPPIHRERVATARQRILDVMGRRVVCYYRELERQVVEVGFNFATTPEPRRPQPVHFGEALKALTRSDDDEEPRLEQFQHRVVVDVDKLKTERYGFVLDPYARDRALADQILQRKVAAVAVYHRVVEYEPELSGWHAEAVHHAALTQSPGWFSVGWQKGAPITRLHDKVLSVGSVDLAGAHLPTGVRFVAEVKNKREWMYESSEPIWALLGAAAELDAVPILIARRVPETVFALMKAVGGIAFRATKLILHPDARRLREKGRPSFVAAARELGFHSDIDYVPVDAPLPRHRALWTRILPPQMPELIERFRQMEDIVRFVAFEEGLRSKTTYGKVSRHRRNRVVQDAIAAVRNGLPE